jgi:hypothetical protein
MSMTIESFLPNSNISSNQSKSKEEVGKRTNAMLNLNSYSNGYYAPQDCYYPCKRTE